VQQATWAGSPCATAWLSCAAKNRNLEWHNSIFWSK
jgi:hypothetical protein